MFGHFWTCSGKVLGAENKFFSKKFWGCLGYVLASSLVSKKGWKNLKSQLFDPKKKLVQIDAESPPDHFPLLLENSYLFRMTVLGHFRFLIFSKYFYFLGPHAAYSYFFLFPRG